MIIVPFLPAHLDGLDLIEEMSLMKPYLENREYADFVDNDRSFTVLVEGSPIACGGIVKVDANKWTAWALMGKETSSYMIGITRAVKSFFSENNKPRIEIHVQDKFKEAHKWAELLGFKCETPNGMDNWGLNNEKYFLYSRCS